MENMNRNQKIDADNLEENKDIMRCNFLIDYEIFENQHNI